MGYLRFFLAVAVVIGHADSLYGLWLLDGAAAVQSFYMISGFYMALVLSTKYRDAAYRVFITNRCLRIYPLYFLVLLLTLPLSAYVFYIFQRHQFGHFHAYPLSGTSVAELLLPQLTVVGLEWTSFVFRDPGSMRLAFTPDFHAAPAPAVCEYLFVPQAWTLSVELMFYAVAPFFVCRLRRLIPVIVVSLLLRVGVYLLTGWYGDPWSYRFFPFELFFFGMGSLAYHIYARWLSAEKQEPSLWLRVANRILIVVLSVYGVAFCALPAAYIGPFSIRHWVFYTLVFVALPLLHRAGGRSPSNRTIGELSYPIYIVHMLVIWSVVFFLRIEGRHLAAVSLALTLPAAWGMMRLQERVERYRR